MTDEKCAATSPAGTECVLPPGHGGFFDQYSSDHYDGIDYWPPYPDDDLAGPAALAGASSVATQLSGLLANLGTALEPVLEATNGYRAKCVAQGYAEDVAGRMAADYHGYLTRMLTESLVSARNEGR